MLIWPPGSNSWGPPVYLSSSPAVTQPSSWVAVTARLFEGHWFGSQCLAAEAEGASLYLTAPPSPKPLQRTQVDLFLLALGLIWSPSLRPSLIFLFFFCIFTWCSSLFIVPWLLLFLLIVLVVVVVVMMVVQPYYLSIYYTYCIFIRVHKRNQQINTHTFDLLTFLFHWNMITGILTYSDVRWVRFLDWVKEDGKRSYKALCYFSIPFVSWQERKRESYLCIKSSIFS